MEKLTGEESNYYVLKQFLAVVKRRQDKSDPILMSTIADVEDFIASKKHIETEIDRLSRKARAGDNVAATELVRQLSLMNDGL